MSSHLERLFSAYLIAASWPALHDKLSAAAVTGGASLIGLQYRAEVEEPGLEEAMGLGTPVSRICRSWPRAACIAMALVIAPASLAQAQAPTSAQSTQVKRPLILVPGLLGSRLCRPDPVDSSKTQVVWGTLGALRQFPTIRLSHDASAKDPIKPCGIVREIVYLGLITQDVYSPIIRHLEKIGYRENRDLFIFDYDWRRSVFDNAATLDRFIRDKAPDGRVDILAHSMGGLVARVYTMQMGGDRVARLISAGSPFTGSAKVFQTVEKGWGALNVAMGGLDGFRRTILSFPSVFELMPRYNGCCDAGGLVAFNPASADTWKSLHWDGVDPATMPSLPETFARIRTLETLIATPLPKGIEDVLLVGVDQRTPQSAGFEFGNGISLLRTQTTWAGDGTVIRDSAVLGKAPSHRTSFANHERILHDPQIQEFLRVALTKSVDEAVASVPVLPRGTLRAIDGSLTELVGIVVEPDEPIYRTGDICKVRVHVRLGDQTTIDPATIKLTRRMPDGREAVIALVPDPAASDPTNPFEQSFVGKFDAGVKPGNGMLRAVVDMAGAKPRIVEQPVPVIAR